MKGATCTSPVKLEGKTVIITGGNCGIGFETARNLLLRGARVILACRDLNKAKSAAEQLSELGSGVVLVEKLDLSSFDSIRTFCKNIKQHITSLDILINNAGVYFHPYAETEDGLEMHMGVNYFGPFLLTHLLLELLKKSDSPRVVFVGSGIYKYGKIDFNNTIRKTFFQKHNAYGDSKLACALFCREFSNRMSDTDINIYYVHPGPVNTDIGRNLFNSFLWKPMHYLFKLFSKTCVEGCQTVVYCAVSEETKDQSGYYYSECQRDEWANQALDKQLAVKLWNFSEKVTGLIE
ncbi:Hypothetical predicted protein [Octopus vulgaris]|uniref:Retinol dehydrogenase 11-like n=1 Tax=Octopus vulgaris TaxID=6645 RepID=A0AA36F9B0_OCTVU|nr:Hypothetical predicted protein [Octopus vulgaris]